MERVWSRMCRGERGDKQRGELLEKLCWTDSTEDGDGNW